MKVLEKELTNNSPLIPSAAKHSISMSCSADEAVLWWTTNASPSSGGPQPARMIRAVGPRWPSPQWKHTGPLHKGPQPQHGHAGGRPGGESGAPSRLAEERRALSARVRLERLA